MIADNLCSHTEKILFAKTCKMESNLNMAVASHESMHFINQSCFLFTFYDLVCLTRPLGKVMESRLTASARLSAHAH